MRIEPHTSARLAWSIANSEASLSGSAEIEPAHLLLGVLSVIDGAYDERDYKGKLSEEDLAQLDGLRADCKLLLSMSDAEITRLRRRIRSAMRNKQPAQPAQKLHRSRASRAVFNQAAAFAIEESLAELTLLHLLKAIIFNPTEDVTEFLPARKAVKPALTWETRVNDFVEQFQITRLTLILTDMEGSTAIKSRYGDIESAKIFRAHDELMRNLLARFDQAREIKTIGDSFLLAFATEEAAVRFALVAQQSLRGHEFLSQIPVKVRIGIYAGNILSKVVEGSGVSDPIFGITIDTTSRIMSLAAGNQILTDRSVHEKTREVIAANSPEGLGPIEWLSHGQYSIKGLDAPLEIFEVGEAGRAAFLKPRSSEKASAMFEATAPLSSARPLGNNLAREARQPETARIEPEFINQIGRDLTELASRGRLAPVVGRKKEMTALARYLQRTSKRNVILIGEAGVGKTAVVEGLAQKLVLATAPDFLRALRIIQINVADIVSGTKYRGDMEKRLQNVLAEASADRNLVLFFDEIHLMMRSGAGGESPMDVANILKPALAQDDFRCIGATTTDEFEKYIKRDAAFMRRFQVLRVSEPSIEEALEICRSWAGRIQEIQQVIFEDEAVVASVILSAQFIRGRSLPDKAIDLLENAAACVKVTSLTFKPVVTKEAPRINRQQIENVLEDQYGISIMDDPMMTRRMGPDVN